MRILQVNTRHFRGGGDSTYTFNLADLLRSQGHDVCFFAMQDERNLPDPNADLFVSHIDFRDLNRRKSLVTGLQVLARGIYSREARGKFRRMLDRVKPDIVHLQNIHAHITASVIMEARSSRLPVVWTLHDYKLVCPNSHFLLDTTGEVCEACGRGHYFQALLKRCKKGSLLASGMAAVEAYAHRWMGMAKQVDAFLAPSAFLRGKLVERGFPAERVHHLPLFLPVEAFRTDGTDEGYLLFLGKLDPIKGIRPMLEACRLSPKVKLILAGRVDGPLAEELPGLLPANAEYVGVKHGDELRGLLDGATAVVLPSVWYENQPFSILEAFAAGKAVIASNLGGMTELVKDDERGQLVRPGDVGRLAKAMTWFAENPGPARSMGEAARRYAWQAHRGESHLRSLMQIYETASALQRKYFADNWYS